MYVMLWISVLTAFRVYRCVWLLSKLAAIAAQRPKRTLAGPSTGSPGC
jgi:hypothetical protein